MAAQGNRSISSPKRKPAAVLVACCGCGETKQRQTWHIGAGDRGDALRYCSMQCYQIARARASASRAEAVRMAKDRQKLVVLEVAALRRIVAYVERPSKVQATCPGCEQAHVVKRGMGRRSRLCPSCAQTRLAEQKRVARSRRKARERNAHVERIDPIAVFESAGWLCYLCGVMTDKDKRGTWHPLAPELEHVVPLSKGGAHTRDNVRCSCRRCNGLKADALPIAA